MDGTKDNEPAKASADQKAAAFGRAFWSIAGKYGLSRSEQALVLGLSQENGALEALAEGLTIPPGDDVTMRVIHLLAIHACLRTIFPYNRDVVYGWMKTGRPEFRGLSAMEFIVGPTPGSHQGQQEAKEITERLYVVRMKLEAELAAGR